MHFPYPIYHSFNILICWWISTYLILEGICASSPLHPQHLYIVYICGMDA